MVRIVIECPPNNEQIMAKLSELAGLVGGLTTKVQKVHDEVQKLKESLEDVDIPADAQAALDNLDTALSGLDELNPDAESPTT